MKTRRTKTKLTIETTEVLVTCGGLGGVRAWCPVCGEVTQMAPVDGAARQASASVRTLYRWLEGGLVHSQETDDGLLICLNSLEACGHHD